MGARPRHSKLRSGKKHQEQTRGNFLQRGFGSPGAPLTPPKSQLWQFSQSSWIKHGRDGPRGSVIAEGGSSPGAGHSRESH